MYIFRRAAGGEQLRCCDGRIAPESRNADARHRPPPMCTATGCVRATSADRPQGQACLGRRASCDVRAQRAHRRACATSAQAACATRARGHHPSLERKASRARGPLGAAAAPRVQARPGTKVEANEGATPTASCSGLGKRRMNKDRGYNLLQAFFHITHVLGLLFLRFDTCSNAA